MAAGVTITAADYGGGFGAGVVPAQSWGPPRRPPHNSGVYYPQSAW